MKCPHCNYKPAKVNPDDDWCSEVENPFFELTNSIKAQRKPYHWDGRIEEKTLHGCPECGKIFLSDETNEIY
ncbi:hypothetical protein N9937_00300 [bacterium]|nr:hypothetical protein [bacterium]